ncbi:hypothetical protein CMV_013534 [Castanea mollissima]|uniref:Uncharacterized protein n=1 Tax=Castanea mollissima TaxID=60419 RepID=A0A8J4QZK7_9ROSI|nr:hypothetical protein CMV_013534 [Castanea mollissima]
MRENCKNQPKLKDVDLFKEELGWPWKTTTGKEMSHTVRVASQSQQQKERLHIRVSGAARSMAACVGGRLVEIGGGGRERDEEIGGGGRERDAERRDTGCGYRQTSITLGDNLKKRFTKVASRVLLAGADVILPNKSRDL